MFSKGVVVQFFDDEAFGVCKGGDVDEALKFYHEGLVEQNKETAFILRYHFLKTEQLEEVEKFLTYETDVLLKIEYEKLTDLYLKKKNYEKAAQYFERADGAVNWDRIKPIYEAGYISETAKFLPVIYSCPDDIRQVLEDHEKSKLQPASLGEQEDEAAVIESEQPRSLETSLATTIPNPPKPKSQAIITRTTPPMTASDDSDEQKPLKISLTEKIIRKYTNDTPLRKLPQTIQCIIDKVIRAAICLIYFVESILMVIGTAPALYMGLLMMAPSRKTPFRREEARIGLAI